MRIFEAIGCSYLLISVMVEVEKDFGKNRGRDAGNRILNSAAGLLPPIGQFAIESGLND